jgi:hypothetical protein
MKKDRSRPMKRLLFACFLILLASIIPQHANAAITDSGTPFYNDPQISTFFSLTEPFLEVAQVASQVYYDHQLGPFVYTYQITNTSTAGISFFSVSILGADEPESPGFDPITGCIDPSYWVFAGSPPSVEGLALFNNNIIAGGESSSLLYFVSDNPPGLGEGTLHGMDINSDSVNATGDLIVPVPEPAALILLGSGWLIAIRRRKRSH